MNSKRQNADRGANSVEGQDEEHRDSGRVKFDDRGNAIWDWQLSTGATPSMTTTQRLRKLDNPTLSLADDAPTPFDKMRSNPLGTKKGYDPYDSGKLGKTAAASKRKDLRRLSDWFKLKKLQSGFKKNSSEE